MAVTAPTIEGIAASARNMLRDLPQFFEVELGPVVTSTIRLPHPNVAGATLQVYTAIQPGPETEQVTHMSPVADDKWVVDERNGLLKFLDTSLLGQRVFVSGYHYEWFCTEDLEFYAGAVVGEHMFQRDADRLDQIPETELDVIAMGTLVRALWSLVTEFSTDIDVSTPEGMSIPARQRFQQVWQMCQHWESLYNDRAKSLNVGLSNIDIFTLRRIAKMTGRYVPVYKGREYDNHNPPERVYPPIPSEETSPVDSTSDGSGQSVSTIEEIGRESQDLGFGGWVSRGTSGSS